MISLQNLIGIKNLIRIALFLIIATYGCNRDTRPAEGKDLVYNINLSSIDPGMANFVKNAKIIPLEMNDQSVIAEIDRLIIDGDDMILFDRRVKQVLVYDTLGTHYSTIKKLEGDPPNIGS